MTPDAYLISAIAVLLTGISKSGFAGGLGILGVPLVALTMEPQLAAAILLPILVGMDVLSVWHYRRAWKARIVLVLLPGAAAGIAVGMVGFASIDADVLRIAIGAMALVFVMRFVCLGPELNSARAHWSAVFASSALSGFAGFVAHAGGPPIKGTLLRLNLDKSEFVGTNAFFFFTLNFAKALGYGALGLFSIDTLVASAWLSPFLFAGVWLGFFLHGKVPATIFAALAHALLAFAGFNLLVVGAVSLLARL